MLTAGGFNRHALVPSPPAYAPLMLWLLLASMFGFAFFLLASSGLVAPVLETDSTHLSALIMALFLLGSLHAGARMWVLSRELVRLERLRAGRAVPEPSLGIAAAYLAAIADRDARPTAQPAGPELAGVLSERARHQHDAGWFLAGLLVKLGLLGTVIGFVLMLRSVDAIESFDVGDVQRVLTLMSGGMGVALYTTLVGLVSSIGLGIQYLFADGTANRFVALVLEHAERRERD